MGQLTYPKSKRHEWFHVFADEVERCSFCSSVFPIAYRHDATIVTICRTCLIDGHLGRLIADGARSVEELDSMLLALRAAAYRTLALRTERALADAMKEGLDV